MRILKVGADLYQVFRYTDNICVIARFPGFTRSERIFSDGGFRVFSHYSVTIVPHKHSLRYFGKKVFKTFPYSHTRAFNQPTRYGIIRAKPASVTHFLAKHW